MKGPEPPEPTVPTQAGRGTRIRR